IDVVQGLIYLHDNEIIHGDIRGCNVLISNEGHAALSDYDLNNIWDTAMFTTIAVVSATRWQAPEVFLHEGDPLSFSEASDIFSFGMLLFEMITLDCPYSDLDNHSDVVFNIVGGVRPGKPLSLLAEADTTWNIIESCWTHERDARPSADEVLTLLLALDA
ncbi:hypothetical protein PLICRDRAFT_112856, partial [Plicaturopsis crispa FD-325 SS-3]